MYEHAWRFVINYFKSWIPEILYKTIMHKYRFGQDYCIDLLRRIPKKFSLHFSEVSSNLHEFWKFKHF
jgi:hypothetical protein